MQPVTGSLDLRASSPGALAGRNKEGKLATTSLEFKYLRLKSRCDLLIGGDGLSNDVITLGWCFSWLLLFRARLPFALIGGNLAAQSTGNHRGVGGGIQIPETQLQALLPFPAPPTKRPESLLAGYRSL